MATRMDCRGGSGHLTGDLVRGRKGVEPAGQKARCPLNLRTTPNGRYWLLKRAGRVVDQRKDSAEEAPAHQPPKGSMPAPVSQAEPPTLDADAEEEEEEEIPDTGSEVPAQDAGPYADQNRQSLGRP